MDGSSGFYPDISCGCGHLDSIKTEFISTLSHEVRTPLSVIILAVEMLKLQGHNCTEAQRQAYIAQIQHAAKEINTLFNAALPTIGADPA